LATLALILSTICADKRAGRAVSAGCRGCQPSGGRRSAAQRGTRTFILGWTAARGRSRRPAASSGAPGRGLESGRAPGPRALRSARRPAPPAQTLAPLPSG
jgi:hypothetical protein